MAVVGFLISLEVIIIFDWLGDLIGGIGDAIGGLFSGAAEAISDWIFDALLQWIYSIIYNAIADFFTMIGNFGAEIFDLPWIQAFIKLFTLLGWALFAVGTVVAIFDVAIEYQNGRANIKSCSVMEQINLQPEDTLYVLGDVIDRFPYGIEILQELIAMPNVKMLLGNHEYMMLNAMDPTYYDSGLHAEDYRDALYLWYDNSGKVTKRKIDKLDLHARKEIFDYLQSLPLSYEITVGDKQYRLIHAAPMELYPDYKWSYLTPTMFTVWYRWKASEPVDYDGTIIFGHTPTYDFAAFDDPMHIYYGDKRIGIDCGSGFPINAPNYGVPHGRLACLRLDDMQEFYSEEYLDDEDTEYSDEQLEAFWDRFADIPMDPETERMEEDFLRFPMGTHREDIWHWFDKRHSRGVYYLLYERNISKRDFNE